MYKMKSDINFSLTHEMLENAENERIHTSYDCFLLGTL